MSRFLSYACIGFLIFLSMPILSQTTMTMQPNATLGKDSWVSDWGAYLNTNFGTDFRLSAMKWTSGGTPYIRRGLIEFDLSDSIPQNAIIVNATLTLYGYNFAKSGSGTTAAYLKLIEQPWDESTVTWNNRPTSTATNQISIPEASSTQNDIIDVTDHVQYFVKSPCNNFGWEYRLQAEATLSERSHYSSDYTTDTTKRPKLVVEWVLPMELSAFTVTHADEDADNASIDITIAEGVPSYTYSWTGPSSFTSSSEDISNLEPGVYYLTVTDDEGYEFHTYFLAGKQCHTITVELQEGANFGFDAVISDYDSCTNYANTDQFLSYKEFSDEAIVDILYLKRGLIYFPTNGLTDDFFIRSAQLELDGWAHDNSTESNASVLLRNTSGWLESSVSWDYAPTYTTTDQVSLASSSSGSQDYSLDLTTNFQYFADNPTSNYGFTLKLSDETWTSMAYDVSTLLFHSSDHATSSNRPKLTIQYTLQCQPHARLQDKVDGSYYIVRSGKLRFKYDEEYNDQDSLLTYKIYNTLRNVVVDESDISKAVYYGDNRYEIDLSCDGENLAQGFYILEVMNEKGERWFLRFYQEDDYSSCS